MILQQKNFSATNESLKFISLFLDGQNFPNWISPRSEFSSHNITLKPLSLNILTEQVLENFITSIEVSLGHKSHFIWRAGAWSPASRDNTPRIVERSSGPSPWRSWVSQSWGQRGRHRRRGRGGWRTVAITRSWISPWSRREESWRRRRFLNLEHRELDCWRR